MSRCKDCYWHWSGAFDEYCHEPDAYRLADNDSDGTCPWFKERERDCSAEYEDTDNDIYGDDWWW